MPIAANKRIIGGFFGEYRWLSNFYSAPVQYEGLTFPSAEHAYQAAKAIAPSERVPFRFGTAAEAKRRGRHIKLRPGWEAAKSEVMYRVCLDKFTRHADLRAKLLGTGDAILIEENSWGDREWGVCNGVGHNKLELILMRVRHELAAQPTPKETP